MSKNIQQLLLTPGWAEIKQKAHSRVEAAKLAALANNDETKFVEMYRKAHAAHDALVEFIQEIEAEEIGA